ncbi:hypothetical protein BX600DRAFT_473704 [Xylariales sp. PMI_506]|nr:hypothetical protein BX600DRAFT_473704 [Xylariales sp. PMI_506]
MKISSSKAPGEVHFVHHSALGEGPSAKSRRHAYSQAARNFHARARRQLTIEYQAAKAAQRKREEGEEKANRQRLRSSSDAPPPWAQDQGFSEGSGRRPNVPSPASLLASDRKDPFSSCARSFRPIEHLLLDHYIRVVIPNMGFHCNRNRGSICHMRPMMISFIQLAVGDASLLNGLFLSASRHLSQHHQDRQFFEQLATQFKVACVQNVSSDISARTSSVIREGTIANVLMLAWDEVMQSA